MGVVPIEARARDLVDVLEVPCAVEEVPRLYSYGLYSYGLEVPRAVEEVPRLQLALVLLLALQHISYGILVMAY